MLPAQAKTKADLIHAINFNSILFLSKLNVTDGVKCHFPGHWCGSCGLLPLNNHLNCTPKTLRNHLPGWYYPCLQKANLCGV